VSFEALQGPLAQNTVAKVLGDDDGREAVEHILREAKGAVTVMLGEHRRVVEALRDALLERDELVGDEIVQVAEAALHAPEVIDLSLPAAPAEP